MAQYKTGVVTVTRDSTVVEGGGTYWLSNALPGNSFIVAGSGTVYDIASVDSDTQITLTAPYRATTRTGGYAIHRDFTPDGIPEMSQGDIETPAIFTRAMRKIQSRLGEMTALAANASLVYPNTTAGMADTVDAEYFWVPGTDGLTLYQNDNGQAVVGSTIPSSERLQAALSALEGMEVRILSLIESLHPELLGGTLRLDFLAQSYLYTEAG